LTADVSGRSTNLGIALDRIRGQFRLSRDELWIRYMALGGTLGAAALGAYLSGSGPIDEVQHNTIVQVLNEEALDAGGDHPVAYLGPP
jgi:hypothetical protein